MKMSYKERLSELKIPQTEIYRSSFFPRSVKDWNTLPDNIVISKTVDILKSKLNRHFD